MNPVKAGLVAKLEDYRFSSASGLLKMDPVPIISAAAKAGSLIESKRQRA
jgi:hypothetical protein